MALFYQGRVRPAMFSPGPDGAMRIGREGRAAIIRGYEVAAGRRVKSPHSDRRRSWRLLMEEEAGAYAAHCRDPEGSPFTPHVIKH